MTVIGVLPIQPSIVVLCRRSVTHGGTPRFTIRLQCVAMCMMIYNSNKDAGIQICVGTSTSTLLFYHDTKMLWSAQLSFVPVYVNISSFSESLRCLLSILSDDCRVFIGYLGTEPSLFRMPITESRFIDFEQRKRDMREFEETIHKHSKDNADVRKNGLNNSLRVEISLNMDHKSMAYDVNENVPSATAVVTVLGVKDQVDVLFQGDVFAHRTNFAFTSRETGNIPITMFVKDGPVLDLRCQIVTITNSAEVLTNQVTLPLQLICREAPPQRTSTHKISLDSTMPSLDIGRLFPEFEQENQSSLGLQPYGSSELTVSIFISNKTNRYRVQSDSTDFLFVVFSELVRRIRQHQPEVKVHCPVPLHLFITAINQHLQIEQKRDVADEHVKRLSIQMRQVESLLLNKLKSDREPFTSYTNALINYTYQELMTGLDGLMGLESQLEEKGTRCLRALLNLMKAVMELSGVHLPFDGRIMDGTDQNLSERLTQLLANDSGSSEAIINSAEEQATSITDIPEEEEEQEEEEEERIEKEEKAREEAISNVEERFEFVDLQSGSLPANFGSNAHAQQQ
uniref:Protein PTHB1 n=1 Tax=Ditylenchus dipsaci TaxID=166011 RepID=A0A915ED19_9BILA